MHFLQVIYVFSISLLLIKSSIGVCQLEEVQKQFCDGFNENGTCRFEMKTIELIKCFDVAEITVDTFGEMENTKDRQYLSLSENEMENINGCAFDDFSYLLYLNLSHNKIRVLSDVNFNSLLNTKIIDISFNNIRLIDDKAMLKVIHLEELYLNNNNLSEVNNFLGECRELKVLDVSFNKISNLEFLLHCTELIHLQISKNDIEYLNATLLLPSLMFLDLSNNKLKYIETKAVTMPNLRLLDLSQNSVLFKKFEQPPYPESSQLHYSHEAPALRTTLPTPPLFKLLKNISSLNTLILSHTGIEELDFGAFSQYTNLEVLDLSHNHLSELPNGIFFELEFLKKLYLNGNNLKKFEYDYNPVLSEIDLNDNAWNCYDLLNLLRSLRNTRIIRKDSNVISTNIHGINCHNIVSSPLTNILDEMKYIKGKVEKISLDMDEMRNRYYDK